MRGDRLRQPVGIALASIDRGDAACSGRLQLKHHELLNVSLMSVCRDRNPPDSQDCCGGSVAAELPLQDVAKYFSGASPLDADLRCPLPGRIPDAYAGHVALIEIFGNVTTRTRTAPGFKMGARVVSTEGATCRRVVLLRTGVSQACGEKDGGGYGKCLPDHSRTTCCWY